MNNQSFLRTLPAPCVVGRARPRHPFTDPFASPIVSPGTTSRAGSEDAPMSPLRRHCFHPYDDEDEDGPSSDIGAEDLIKIRRKYLIHESVKLRYAGVFEHALDGGIGEMAIFEAYLEAGFRGGVPFLIAEVSSQFGLYPSHLMPATWHTLMAIQVFGELHSIPFGLLEILYSNAFVPLTDKKGFYQI